MGSKVIGCNIQSVPFSRPHTSMSPKIEIFRIHFIIYLLFVAREWDTSDTLLEI